MMKQRLVVAGIWVFLGTSPICLADDRLADFVSDGCSAFPDGTYEERALWQSCCVIHDLAYWLGGTRSERKQADIALKECVAGVGEPTIAQLMLAGVTVGGTPWLPTQFRWGYGWPFWRGYSETSEEEKPMVEEKTHAALQLINEAQVEDAE